jgi:Fe(3+) dicitrate transport protein
MNKYILSFVCAVITTFSVFSQTGSIVGKVHFNDSLNSLPGVSIYLEKTNFGTISNGKGDFNLKNIPVGNYTLVAYNLGYKTEKREITVKENEIVNYRFILKESVMDLPLVVIQSSSLTGGQTGIKDIPGSAYYLSPKEIQKFSYTDINRTLRAIPGVNIQEEDGFGLRPNLGLRGTGVERTSKITIMEDGVLMAPAPYSAPAAYYFPTIGRMQAVEVLKGSSQIKYGPFTTGGAINLISTQIPDELAARIHLTGGNFGIRNTHAYIGNSHKNVAYLLETFQYSANGFKQLDNNGNTGFDKKDYLAKIRVNTNEDAKIYQSLTLKLGQTSELSNETYLGITENDFNQTPYRRYAGSQEDYIVTAQNQFSATHVMKLSKNIDITTTGYYNNFSRNWYKLDKVKDSTGTTTSIGALLNSPEKYADAYDILTGASSTHQDALTVKANKRDYYTKGLQSTLGVNFNTGSVQHKLDVGFRAHYDQMDRYQHEDKYKMVDGTMMLTKSGTPGTESNRIAEATAYAGFVQYQIRYKNLTVVPGVRYENIFLKQRDFGKNDPERTGSSLKENENHVSAIVPGVGVDYKFSNNLSTFFGIHKGFAPPGSTPESMPEESINYELGTRFAKNGLSGQVIGFLNNYHNLLGTDLAAAGGGGTGDMFNGGKAISKGIEFQAVYDLLYTSDLSFSLPFSLVYTYTDAYFLSDFKSSFEDWGTVSNGDKMPYLANHQFTIMLSLEHRKFNVNFSGRYMDAMRMKAGKGPVATNEKTDAYFIVDASASYWLHPKLALFANINNLTNQTYIVANRPAGLRPGMPRSYLAGIKFNF